MDGVAAVARAAASVVPRRGAGLGTAAAIRPRQAKGGGVERAQPFRVGSLLPEKADLCKSPTETLRVVPSDFLRLVRVGL